MSGQSHLMMFLINHGSIENDDAGRANAGHANAAG